jgi:hypothetical protein
MIRQAGGDGLIVAQVIHGHDVGLAEGGKASIDFRGNGHRGEQAEQGGQTSRHVGPFGNARADGAQHLGIVKPMGVLIACLEDLEGKRRTAIGVDSEKVAKRGIVQSIAFDYTDYLDSSIAYTRAPAVRMMAISKTITRIANQSRVSFLFFVGAISSPFLSVEEFACVLT